MKQSPDTWRHLDLELAMAIELVEDLALSHIQIRRPEPEAD